MTLLSVAEAHARLMALFLPVGTEDVPLAADILTDILRHSTFDAEEYEKERHVILQEIGETQDTPSDLVFDQFQEAAFPNQPIGRSILGSEAIIETLPRDALQTFIDSHYGPEALIVAASGKVEHDAIVALATEKLIIKIYILILNKILYFFLNK